MRLSTVLPLILLSPASARAGRTHFGWLYGTTTLPERTVELESWFLEETGKGDDRLDEALLWWGPVVGLTDELELPFRAKVVFAGKERSMGTAQSTGDCNSCHTATGANGAPGRIVLP